MKNSIKMDLKIINPTSASGYMASGHYVVINTLLEQGKFYSTSQVDEILINRKNKIIQWINDNTDIDGEWLTFKFGMAQLNKNKLYISISEKYKHIMPAFKMEFSL